MIEVVQALRERHREVLGRMEHGEADDRFVDDVLALLDDMRLAGALVTGAVERAQLRSILRFWSGVVYDYTGRYPTVTLLPVDVDDVHDSRSSTHPTAPPLLWLLVGGASVAVILAALVVVGWVSRFSERPVEVVRPVAMVPRVRQVAAEQGLGAGATLPIGIPTFCRGAADAVFHLVLDGYEPDMELQWRVLREGTELSTRPAVPYGNDGSESLTIRVGSGVPGGLVAGVYDLSLEWDGDLFWVQTFKVLSVAPRTFGLQVSDVPVAADSAAAERQFAPGLRVVFLRYRYEGLCSGLQLTHRLHLGGEAIQAIEQIWRGDPEGETQVIFQGADGASFVPGDYEISVSVSGVEHGRVGFRVLGVDGA